MIFSFTSPTHKPILTPITKSWLICIMASTLVVMGIWLILSYQTDAFVNQSNTIDQEINRQENTKTDLVNKLDFLNMQISEVAAIKGENTILINAIENLFGLIPDQITLNTISLTDNTLTIKGITPSKELYTFLLESPLKAIFSETNADFFVLPSGWYNFVSISKVINPQKGGEQ